MLDSRTVGIVLDSAGCSDRLVLGIASVDVTLGRRLVLVSTVSVKVVVNCI